MVTPAFRLVPPRVASFGQRQALPAVLSGADTGNV